MCFVRKHCSHKFVQPYDTNTVQFYVRHSHIKCKKKKKRRRKTYFYIDYYTLRVILGLPNHFQTSWVP